MPHIWECRHAYILCMCVHRQSVCLLSVVYLFVSTSLPVYLSQISLCLTHTHTHTHTLPLLYLSLVLLMFPVCILVQVSLLLPPSLSLSLALSRSLCCPICLVFCFVLFCFVAQGKFWEPSKATLFPVLSATKLPLELLPNNTSLLSGGRLPEFVYASVVASALLSVVIRLSF
jgi:hypothetical protein